MTRTKRNLVLLSLLIIGPAFSQMSTEAVELNHQSITFIKNKGQWNSNVQYRSALGTGSVYLENNTFTYQQLDAEAIDHAHHHSGAEHNHDDHLVNGHAWRVHFIGANETPRIIEMDKRTEYHNYFLGNDPSKWTSNVPLFNTVEYDELYPGVDMKVYSHEGFFKYDFIVAPGVSTGQIKIQYTGLENMRLKNGNLVMETTVGNFVERAPYAYQIIAGVETEVPCNFVLVGNELTFEFPAGYDGTLPLVIDPTLEGATLSGSTVTNYGHCATYDNDENIYTGARCFGAGYPATDGAFQMTFGGGVDIAVSKLNPDASALIYATYLGGGGNDLAHSMVVNDDNEIYVLGTTLSIDYPVGASAFDTDGPAGGVESDLVISHLTEDGTGIVGSTYIGTDGGDGQNGLTSNYADTFRGEIIVDSDGNCYVASCTSSDSFPVTAGAYQETYGGGAQDAVIFSMPPDLESMNWATYLGGTMGEGAFSLRLDADDNVYVCGAAQNEFMTMSGYQTTYQGGELDAYVIRLIDDGTAISASSYWGTTSKDASFFLDLDNDGNVFLYGQSDAGTSEVTPGVYANPGSQQFICKLSPDLATLGFGTVVGSGSGGVDFIPIAFMVDACGYIYFSGHSADFAAVPLSDDALYETGGMYLGVLEPEAVALEYATKYSGNHVDGGTSRFDPANGTVYQAVCSCEPFTTTPGAYSNTSGGFCDMAVFKIDFGISHVNANADADPSSEGCAPFTVDFENTGSGVSYQWDFGDGSPTSTEFEPTHTFTDPGIYEVQLIAYDPDGCLTSDTTYVEIIVGGAETPTAAFDYDIDCATGTVTVTYTGTPDVPVVFDMGDGSDYEETEFSHTYTGTGTFTITLTAGDGVCADTDVITEDILIGSPSVEIIMNDPTCHGFSDGSVTVSLTSPTGEEVIEISDQEGTILNVGGSNTANTLNSGWYIYHVDLGDGCETTDSVFLNDPPAINAQLNITNPLCHGDETGIVVVDTVYNTQGDYGDIVYIWAPDPPGVSGIGADSIYGLGAGTYVLTINDDFGCSEVFDFEITQPPLLEFSEFGTEPAYCRLFGYQSGNGVVFGAAIGGTPDYTYQWEYLETGETSINTTWGGRNPGTYEFTVTDENGCILTQQIELDSLNPEAKMTVINPQVPTDCDAIVPVEFTFTNESINFSNPNDPDTDSTFYFNPNVGNEPWTITHDITDEFAYTYTERGEYEVCLVAQNNNGCTDTTCQTLLICQDLEFEPINIFSPDGDGINDIFTFEYRSKAVIEFKCLVVDRWGVVIREFNDINDGWDGTDQKGNPVPDGVYFYSYSGKGETGEIIDGMGTAQVVRSK